MKINEGLKIIGEYLQQALKFNGAFLSVVFTLAGAYTSYTIFRSLGNFQESKTDVKIRDTMFVKLVDVPEGLNSPVSYARQNDGDSVRLQSSGGGSPIGVAPRHDSSLRSNYIPAHVINDSDMEAAVKKHSRDSFLTSSVTAAILSVILFLFWIAWKTLPYIPHDMVLDKDPEELKRVFNTYRDEIEVLGNPRKIKRLSNKIRFQYQFLSLKNLINKNSARTLVVVLLMLESRNLLSDRDFKDLKDAMESLQHFKDYFGPRLRNRGLPDNGESLMGYLFSLNRDSFA
ncbi:hypothetical protein [Chitinophaga sp. S165]|uniref:hypothetical protein n=1 Tax=Chitinophaga sp. S165 TaxID=2135462 RepID=UPI000D71582B|nr:hypothetical protein [Chitinophaga sp. S165]PWV56131.1 hypothetical protein C7475_101645 [Chitinophaga sp. S165]